MRSTRPRFSVAFGLVIALLGLSAGLAAAAIPGTDGTIHGCYSQRNGALRIIDPAVTACTKSETAIAFAQEGPKGDPGDPGPAIESLDGVPCDSVSGPGTIETRNATNIVKVSNDGTYGYPVSVYCDPDGAYVKIQVVGLGTVSVSPAPAYGSADCVGDDALGEVDCVLFYPAGTEVTLTATPDAGYHLFGMLGPVCGLDQLNPVCTLTVNEPGANTGAAFFPNT